MFSCVILLVLLGHVIGTSKSIGCALRKVGKLKGLVHYKQLISGPKSVTHKQKYSKHKEAPLSSF